MQRPLHGPLLTCFSAFLCASHTIHHHHIPSSCIPSNFCYSLCLDSLFLPVSLILHSEIKCYQLCETFSVNLTRDFHGRDNWLILCASMNFCSIIILCVCIRVVAYVWCIWPFLFFFYFCKLFEKMIVSFFFGVNIRFSLLLGIHEKLLHHSERHINGRKL